MLFRSLITRSRERLARDIFEMLTPEGPFYEVIYTDRQAWNSSTQDILLISSSFFPFRFCLFFFCGFPKSKFNKHDLKPSEELLCAYFILYRSYPYKL